MRLQRHDLGVTAIYLIVCLALPPLGVTMQPLLGTEPLWGPGASTALIVLAALGTLPRRHMPAITLAVTGILSTIEMLGGSHLGAYILIVEALWAPIVHGSRRLAHTTTGCGVALSIAMLAVLASAAADQPGAGVGMGIIVGLLLVTVIVATPLAWGWEVRHLHLARRTAEQLAEAQQALAAERADRAISDERRRIAQDLHDVLAGHLSAVSLHTRLADALPDADSRGASLQTARDSAQSALRDLRAVIDVLTEPEAASAPRVTLTWDSLADRLRVGGRESLVAIEPRMGDARIVDPASLAALLRIGSEAVTNALTHGRGPRQLLVAIDGDDALMTCTNPIDGTGASQAQRRVGLGLSTMTARARAVGGSLTAGPDPHDPRIWRVEARVPRRAGARTGAPTRLAAPVPGQGSAEEHTP